MGAPIPETILLNRAIAEYDTVFDDIALTYDSIFDGEFFKEENKLLFNKLGYEHGSVLDVGCGTGIFLDYEIPEAYVGVDISKTMLKVLKDKHYHRKMRLIITTVKDLYLPEKYDYVIALYGQGSYLSDSEMSKLVDYAKDDGKLFIMIYKEGIIPYVNRFTNLEPDYNTLHDYENTIKSRGLTVEEFHNYHILTR
jgi:SAM-dependent methyltransferase